MSLSDKAKEELNHLRAQAPDGLLHPDAVVAFAKDEATALHEAFEWDDSEAAQQWRLQQARQVIRVYVRFDPVAKKDVRAMVSVPSDRANGGGYRPTENLLPQYRTEVVTEALKKIGKTRQSYSFLPELLPFFDELDALIARHVQVIGQVAHAG